MREEKDFPAGAEEAARAVRRGLLKARLDWLSSRGAAALAAAAPPVLFYLSGAALADRVFFLDGRLRLSGLGLCLAWALFRLYADLLRPLAALDRARLAAEIASASPPLRLHIGPAADLAARGARRPGPFGAEHLRQTAALLAAHGFRLPPAARFSSRRAAAAAAALLLSAAFVPSSLRRVALPSADGPLELSLAVSPGDARVREGESVTIRASWLDGSAGEPSLSVREGAGWRRREWSVCAGGSCGREVRTGPGGLEYRMEFRGRRTRTYRLEHVPRPSFSSLTCEFFPPPYSGLPSSAPDYCPASVSLKTGGRLRLEAVPSYEPAGIFLSGPGGVRVSFSRSPGGEWELELRPSAAGSYEAVFTEADGRRSPLGGIISLELEDDAAPVPTLLGAAGGRGGASAALLYEVSDDLGLAEVRIVRGGGGAAGPEKEYTVFLSSPPGPRSVMAEEFLSLHDAAPGSAVPFRVKARDFNPAAGWVLSAPLELKAGPAAAGGAGEVYRARAALEELRLAEERFAGRLESGGGFGGLEELGPAWRELPGILREAGAADGGDPAAAAAGKVLSGLAGPAGREASVRVPAREKAAAAGDAAGTASLGAQLRSFLEKASAEADAAAGALFAGSLSDSLSDAEAAARELERDLLSAREGGSLKREKLDNLLERINAELSALLAALDGVPAAPPEGRVYRLPLGSAMELASALAGDLAAGDLDAAIEKAGRLLDKLAVARRVAAERMEELAASSPQGRASAEAGALAAAAVELASDQAALLEDTRSRHDSLLSRRAAGAGPHLALAAELGAQWLSAAGPSAPGAAEVRAAVAFSSSALPAGALTKLKEAARLLSVSTQAAAGPFIDSLERQAAELEKALGAQSLLDPDDEAFLASAASRQEGLAVRADGLVARAEAAAREFPSVGGGPAERFAAAAGHMRAAAAALKEREFEAALRAQEAALKELEKGGQDLSDYSASSSALSRPGSAAGRSPAGPAGGRARIPGGGDYVPPDELRRRVLDSLRERYPEERRKEIEDYLRGVGR